MTPEEIAEFEALREQRERSRDLEGIDDGGEANRIREEIQQVASGPASTLETGGNLSDL